VPSKDAAWPGIQEYLPLLGPSCHSSFFYICPGDKVNPGYCSEWYPEAKGFFKSHPEFYTMIRDGKRVDTQQLCFSNREMRQTLTRHLLERIKIGGGRGMVDVSANDVPGSFCHCPECVALEQFYVLGYPFRKWDVYASLKVEGPGYDATSTAAKNRIWCDRVVLVEAAE
jgi:hypothetical protein